MLRLCLVLAVTLFTAPATRATEPGCPKAPEIRLALPGTRAALAKGEPIVVVAFGSSSTQGSAASDRAHSYPAILQTELAALLPAAHFAVINRGIGGQDAAEELIRIGRDVNAIRPQLVIWQIGANAALRNNDPVAFAANLQSGISMLQESGADIVLMDNQRARRVLEAPQRVAIEQVVARVAKASGAALFSRGALMDAWAAAGAPYETFIAADGMHHNDLGYRCVADALATAISSALHPAADTDHHLARR